MVLLSLWIPTLNKKLILKQNSVHPHDILVEIFWIIQNFIKPSEKFNGQKCKKLSEESIYIKVKLVFNFSPISNINYLQREQTIFKWVFCILLYSVHFYYMHRNI